MKIKIKQSTNLHHYREASQEFDGSLKEYAKLQLEHIQQNPNMKITDTYVGEDSFKFKVIHEEFGVLTCEGLVIE